MARHPALRPVFIAQGTLAPGRPSRKMLVSRQHAFLSCGGGLRGVIGRANALIRARHITEVLNRAQMRTGGRLPVHYFHLLFDRHEIIRVDHVWAESFFAGPGGLAAHSEIGATLRLATQPMQRARPLLSRSELRPVATAQPTRHQASLALALAH